MPESAAEMARQYGLDGKTFRRALRAEGVPWHRLGDRWDPPEGSSEYQEMLRVAERLAGDRSRRTAVRVKTPMQQINRTQYEENIRIFKKRIGDDQCPIWPSEAAISSGSVPDRFLHYWSPAAGGMFRTRYDMTYPGSPLERLDNETRKRVSSWIWSQNVVLANLGNDQTAPIPILTPDIIENLAQQSPLTIEQRIDRALQAIGRPPAVIDKVFVTVLGNMAIQNPDLQQQLLFRAATECGSSQDEYAWLLDEMTDAGLLKAVSKAPERIPEHMLTVQGLNRLETSGTPLVSRTAFAAMWFGSEVTDVYEKGIKPAITEAGYESVRIDEEEHINKIDDEIIAEIHRARFVVCDLTCGLVKNSKGQDTAIARGSVYYEAGFAHGLDKPVIWTCREDLIGQAHFDVRQYSMISWKKGEEEALRDALVNRIRAVIT